MSKVTIEWGASTWTWRGWKALVICTLLGVLVGGTMALVAWAVPW